MREKILVHVCCGPCFVAPSRHLREAGFELHGFWFNPNIHPYTEYKQRLDSAAHYLEEEKIPFIIKDEYNLEDFLRKAAFREATRCRMCYYERLKYTAIIARKGNFDYFTTTLLYSKFQNHELIKEVAESLAKEYGVKFYYDDFRKYWKEGIQLSKEKDMYRQQYCGCIYSEKERYLGKSSK